MPQPSPFDLIQKAARRSTAADRWAELKVNTQQRVPLAKPAKPQPPEYPEEPMTPQVQQPPFAPPQPRHPYVDEVVQRHEQAWKNALPLQSWVPKAAQIPPPSVSTPITPPAAKTPAQPAPAPTPSATAEMPPLAPGT